MVQWRAAFVRMCLKIDMTTNGTTKMTSYTRNKNTSDSKKCARPAGTKEIANGTAESIGTEVHHGVYHQLANLQWYE
jgi:hypothetical protein